MNKLNAIFYLGIASAVMPFLGFPGTWKLAFACASGAIIAYLAYELRRDVLKHTEPKKDIGSSTYVESSIN